jgi:hypothetical protein
MRTDPRKSPPARCLPIALAPSADLSTDLIGPETGPDGHAGLYRWIDAGPARSMGDLLSLQMPTAA